MKNKNISTLNSMIRLSRIIRNFKNARRELNQVKFKLSISLFKENQVTLLKLKRNKVQIIPYTQSSTYVRLQGIYVNAWMVLIRVKWIQLITSVVEM